MKVTESLGKIVSVSKFGMNLKKCKGELKIGEEFQIGGEDPVISSP